MKTHITKVKLLLQKIKVVLEEKVPYLRDVTRALSPFVKKILALAWRGTKKVLSLIIHKRTLKNNRGVFCVGDIRNRSPVFILLERPTFY